MNIQYVSCVFKSIFGSTTTKHNLASLDSAGFTALSTSLTNDQTTYGSLVRGHALATFLLTSSGVEIAHTSLIFHYYTISDATGNYLLTLLQQVDEQNVVGGPSRYLSIDNIRYSGVFANDGTVTFRQTSLSQPSFDNSRSLLQSLSTALGAVKRSVMRAYYNIFMNGSATNDYLVIQRYMSGVDLTEFNSLSSLTTSIDQFVLGGAGSPNSAPTASFTYTPSSGTAPLLVSVDASASSDTDGDTLTYSWNFGDTGTATGVTASHTYNSSGVFTIVLTVTDTASNTATASHTIAVSSGGTAPAPKALPTNLMTMTTTYGEGQYLTFTTMTVPLIGRNYTKYVAQDGNWNDPITWSDGAVPTSTDKVLIQDGATVTITDTSSVAETVIVQGTLSHSATANTQLRTTTIMVMDADSTTGAGMGSYSIGDDTTPIGSGFTATLLFMSGVDFDYTEDPEQWGHGLIAAGMLRICGNTVDPTFVRLSTDAKAGDTALQLSSAVTGWNAGDRLLIPDSRHLTQTERNPYNPQWENPIISSVTNAGLTINLAAPLQFDHLGARSVANSSWVNSPSPAGPADYLPHVANLSRNVIIKPEDPVNYPAHGMAMGMADAMVCHALFYKMGRTTNQPLDNTTFDSNGNVTHIGTNEIGRYAFHFHHCIGPSVAPSSGYQFMLQNCSFDNGDDQFGGWGAAGAWDRKWSITVHDSHFGLVEKNIVYNCTGSGIALEDGTEYHNIIQNNFICRVRGTGARENAGRDGVGLWSHGPMSHIRNNVSTNVIGDTFSYGFSVTPTFVSFQRIPNAPGVDKSQTGNYTVVDVNSTPLLEYANNEAYGALTNGFTFWHLGTFGDFPTGNISGVSTMLNCVVWHHYNFGLFLYPTDEMTVDGFIVRCDPSVAGSNIFENPLGIWSDDYPQKSGITTNADIQGCWVGFKLPRYILNTYQVENSNFVYGVNVYQATPYSTNGGGNIPSHSVTLTSLAQGSIPGSAGTHSDITREYYAGGGANVITLDQMFVVNHNNVVGDNFRVFYTQQDPSFVVPQTYGSGFSGIVGATQSGLTNQQHSDLADGQMIAGELATCLLTRGGITGYVC